MDRKTNIAEINQRVDFLLANGPIEPVPTNSGIITLSKNAKARTPYHLAITRLMQTGEQAITSFHWRDEKIHAVYRAMAGTNISAAILGTPYGEVERAFGDAEIDEIDQNVSLIEVESVMAKQDYYELLGVQKGASADEIKKAFRRAAVQHHPDRGGDEAKFKEINEAYEILKDPSKRQRYDQFGHAGVGSSAASDGNPFGGGGFGGFSTESANFDFGDLGLGDIFSSFFGGDTGAETPRGRHTQNRGRDVETSIEITFEQAVFGTDAALNLAMEDVCEHCKGSMTEPGYELKKCDECNGSGQISKVTRTIFGNIQQATVCPKCHGRGQIPEKECTVCHGRGTKRSNQTINIKIPAGIDDGATIRLRQQGEAVAGGIKGDLYVNVRVKPHKKFTREGELILSNEQISMIDAALGTEIEVDTVDGPVKMKVPIGTQSGTDFKLSGHGVPRLSGGLRGAHIVTVVVQTPTKLNSKQKTLLQQFKKESGKGRGIFNK